MLSVKVKIVFNLERNVFIFEERLKVEVFVSKGYLKIRLNGFGFFCVF